MNREQIEELLEEAKHRFLRDEVYLLAADVNERSLTHKFAEHLQTILGRGWSVDCEYNRYGTDTKTIEDVKEIVGREAPTDETRAKTVYPDIIVHRRGVEGPNLLVIEAKKDASRKERDDDWRKLERIKAEYRYDFAAFINIVTSESRVVSEVR
jgi:hypothetical protein